MISQTWTKYRALSREVKGMLGAYWVYELAEQIIVVFMGIFVYTKTESLFFMSIYYAIYFTAILIGFSGWGLLMTRLGINMKWNHVRAYGVNILAFVWFWFFRDENWHLLVFGALNGLGIGIFWLGHHSFEMLHTKDKSRDFYSSMLGTGTHVTAILGPLIATVSFFFSDFWFKDPLTLIFFLLPLIYIFAIPFLMSLPSYVPNRIAKEEWLHIKSDPTIRHAKKFAFAESLGWGAWGVIIPLIAVTALETYINIGIFNTILGLLAIFMVLVQGHKQNKGNRVKVFHISVAFMVFNFFIMYFWTLSPWIYIILGLTWVPIFAVHSTILHVVMLKNIDQMRGKDDCFFAGLLNREVVIWLGRLFSILVLGSAAYLLENDILITYLGITWLIGQHLLMMWTVDRVLKD